MSNLDPLKTTGRWLAAGAWPLGLFVVALVLGIYLGMPPKQELDADATAGHTEEQHASEGLWTCSMHPSVQLPSPGQCPICFMDLIPKVERAPGSLSVADAEVTRLGLESRPARHAPTFRDLALVGRLAFDETRMTTISAWVPGRIDRLFVDSTGITVRAGDHLAELYSPPLYQAQIELAQAEASLARTRERDPSGSLVAAQEASVAAVRERLRLWGLAPEQIAELGAPKDHITINSPVTGVVVTRDVVEGHYVDTGKLLYSIADTSVLWAELEAFESDLPWLHLGQMVTLETDSLPGQRFEGELSFVEPWLNRKSRTARLRIEVPNPRGELRPEMLVRARVHARIGADGRALGTEIDGRFACPMHPAERSDAPGECSICGMPLEPLADLARGFAPSGASPGDVGDPLVIPASAPLLTGRRAVVYVDTPGNDGGREYSLREVVLGPRAGDLWVVLEGLEAGERVVTRGAFKLDSELELTGSVSWMSSGTWDAEPEPVGAPSFASPGSDFDAAVGDLWA
ncbi:MAG: efflux RND transporter periplasmic adaptor subunit, partial [Planctomycetota bacterium]|nr:efflux RND transporter periplasmic adaptor subunit [Planctomycetota bacterium]